MMRRGSYLSLSHPSLLQDPNHLILVGRSLTNSTLPTLLISLPPKKQETQTTTPTNTTLQQPTPQSAPSLTLSLTYPSLNYLTLINLSKNLFTYFPEEICFATNLQNLNLSSNKIDAIPPQISRLTTLRSLNLSHNKLSFLPDQLCELCSLEKLKLSHNSLLKLPITFYNLTSLTSLKITSNPIICPPLFVVSKGIPETFEWLKGMETIVKDPRSTHNELFMFSTRESFQLSNPSLKPWNRSITVDSNDLSFYDSNQNVFFTIEHGVMTGQGRRKYMEDMHSIHRELKISRHHHRRHNENHHRFHENPLKPRKKSITQDQYGHQEFQNFQSLPLEEENEEITTTSQTMNPNPEEYEDKSPIPPSPPTSQPPSPEPEWSEEVLDDYSDIERTSSTTSLSSSSTDVFPSVSFFGVYDGHSGIRAAAYAQEHLQRNIFATEAFSEGDYKAALVEGFETTDREWLKIACENDFEDGTTATVVLLVNNELYVGNVGDSTAILSREFRPVLLSLDHKPTLKDEAKRIKESGGWIGRRKNGHSLRVQGDLAMTRCIGDKRLKVPTRVVIATPTVTHLVLKPSDQFIIIASDGIWDGISHQNAINVVSEHLRAQEAAEHLFECAARISGDNLTCIVIFIRWDVSYSLAHARPVVLSDPPSPRPYFHVQSIPQPFPQTQFDDTQGFSYPSISEPAFRVGKHQNLFDDLKNELDFQNLELNQEQREPKHQTSDPRSEI